MAIKLNQRQALRTVAELANNARAKGRRVNVENLAKGRDMMVSSVKTTDGSTIKLLENYNEVDVIVMKDGRVLTAKGKFMPTEKATEELAEDAMCRIANHAMDGEELHVQFIA